MQPGPFICDEVYVYKIKSTHFLLGGAALSASPVMSKAGYTYLESSPLWHSILTAGLYTVEINWSAPAAIWLQALTMKVFHIQQKSIYWSLFVKQERVKNFIPTSPCRTLVISMCLHPPLQWHAEELEVREDAVNLRTD